MPRARTSVGLSIASATAPEKEGPRAVGKASAADRKRLPHFGVTTPGHARVVPRKRQGPRVLHRTARVELRTTPAQRERCFGLLRSGADLWAAVLELNALRRQRGDAPIVTYQGLCRELTRAGPGWAGELSTTGARSILRRYSDAWFTAAARRRDGDERAHFPRRRRSLMSSCHYAGTFSLEGRHLALPTTRGAPPLALRLTRQVPYDPSSVRSVTLLNVGPRLFVEVTTEVPVASYAEGTGPDPDKVAGVDLGIIHPFAVAGADQGAWSSGRAIRAENRLHLAEKKARARAVSKRAPKKGQRGSRRWRRHRSRTRKLEERHRRRVAQATHEGARAVVDFAVAAGIGTPAVGDPRAPRGRRRRTAPEPGREQLAPRTGHRRPHRQGGTGRHHRRAGRRTGDQFDLSELSHQGGQTQGPEVLLCRLWPSCPSRCGGCHQHRLERDSRRRTL